MDTLICAGGTGSRVLKSVLHLCAMGLGPEKLRVFVIDPDATNGNGKDTSELVTRYRALRTVFHESTFGFFRTELDLLRPEGDNQGLHVWSPVKASQTFRKVLNYEGLSREQKDVVHLLYTEDELDMEMTIGYQGHPALGAAALALLDLFKHDTPLLAQFSAAVKGDVSGGNSNVVIVGSVFGGTGASTIHPLLKYLRSDHLLENRNTKNLKVAAVALTPYFHFSAAKSAKTLNENLEKTLAKSEDFPLASRAAAEYYNQLRESGDWEFDAMYWVGDDSPKEVQYAPGSESQKNDSHFVDLLAAFGCMDFFSNQPSGGKCWYLGPDVPEGTKNTVTMEDLPLRERVFDFDRQKLQDRIALFQTMAIAQLGFYGPLLNDPQLKEKPHYVPWFYKHFRAPKDDLAGDAHRKSLEALEFYWKNDYLPWWKQIHDANGRVRLLNTAAWTDTSVDATRLANVLYPDGGQHPAAVVNHFYEQMVDASESQRLPDHQNAASRYLTLLGLAAQQATANYGTRPVVPPQR